MNTTAKRLFVGLAVAFVAVVGAVSKSGSAPGGFRWLAETSGMNIGAKVAPPAQSADAYDWR